MSHKAHEAYSAKNPVPKVALKSVLDPRGATETKAKSLTRSDKGDKKRQDQHTSQSTEKGVEKEVKDPVTGEKITVVNAAEDTETDELAENILGRGFPPPNWKAHQERASDLTQTALIQIIAAFIVIPVLFHVVPIPIPIFSRISTSHPHAYALVRVILSLLPPSTIAYFIFFSLRNKAYQDFDNYAWNAERERGLAANQDLDGDGEIAGNERARESAEWLNTLLRGIWPIINPEMFSSAVDMLEDIMQSSVPKFVHSVRVSDLGQGDNPIRITALRSLPDVDTVDVLQGADDQVKDHLKRDHINLEVSFAYQALPSGATASSKAHNAHLLIEFFLGMRGVWGFILPVWVELVGMSGTARARIEMIPDPPFMKTTMVSLMGLPRISIAVVPMARSLPNMMNIPLLSTFISNSIDAACAEYVAPKSLTLDLQQLISGDDIKKDTEAIGILVVHIHRATGLKKMDSRGSSDLSLADPYVTLAYSRQGKPLYSTRIIKGDLNPVFEETAALTVDANSIKIGESLSLQLWDSDRASVDDMMGFVEVDLLDLIRNKNKPERRQSPLESPDSSNRPGTLEYTVGYFAKMAPNGKLATDGADPAIPEDLKQDPAFKEARAIALNDLEAAVLVTPPDPAWPSGILSVQVHEIRELGIKTAGRESKGKQEGEKGQDVDADEQEEGEGLPSSYCTIALNDDMVYSTRVKPITASPTFNAGTERFVRDWRTAHVSVVVRDSRMRENDPILGIIFLKLSELLVNASEVTRFFPMENGIGYGSIRISVLFRPVRANLPPQLLGFETGTLLIRDVSLKAGNDEAESLGQCEIRLKTSTSEEKISKKKAKRGEDGTVVWHEEHDPTELVVRQRYSSAVTLAFRTTGGLKNSGNKALATIWLRDIVDNESKKLEVPLWRSEDYSRLEQNYIPLDGDLGAWDMDKEKLTRIGTLQVDLTFQPGVTTAHKKALKTSDPAKRRVWEEVDRREAGLTDKVGQQEGSIDDAIDGGNTEVDKQDVQVEEKQDGNGQADSGDDGSEDDSEGQSKGMMSKLKKWRKHEHELHLQHRGIMQKKPARTAAWLKENAEQAGNKVKDRFAMKAREPDVETEV